MLCKLIRIVFFFVNWPILISIATSMLISSLSSSSSTYVCLLEFKTTFNFPASTLTKILLVMQKFEFSSKSLDETTQYGSTNSLSWKTLFPIVNSSLPSWTTLTRPLDLIFTTDNQSALERSFLKKGLYV